MKITADLVKTLRERTGAGMMECKTALVDCEGDVDRAADALRKKGIAKADKKAGRIAAEGVIASALSADGKHGVLVEVNCETDFVASGDDFRAFADGVAEAALGLDEDGVESLLAAPLRAGESVEEARRALIARIGENITVRRFARLRSSGHLGRYIHQRRIGVLVAYSGGDDALGLDLAMHVAASKPVAVAATDVAADVVAKEREIFAAQAAAEGKPPHIVEKMIEGRVRKFLAEITLHGQPFVKDPDTTVEKLVGGAGARVEGFVRLEVGEGIEKQASDFVGEVMKQVRGDDAATT
jgi:elongation factor Ts